MKVNSKRVHKLNEEPIRDGAVIYWMSREQRMEDNWALLYAQELARDRQLTVVFNLVPEFSEATLRQYSFMLEGLKELQSKMEDKNIPLYILSGKPQEEISCFVDEKDGGILVTDFDPLKIKRQWIKGVKDKVNVAFYEVDAHNIVPCRRASQKQEYAAYTIRPKINKLLPEFLVDFPEVKKQEPIEIPSIDWNSLYDQLTIDRSVTKVDWIKPGVEAARDRMKGFIQKDIEKYPQHSNDPNKSALSNLSPYLHFGQISAQRIALEVNKADVSEDAKEEYLEQLIVRRELSDNYCFYNENYDSVEGAPDWAKKTIREHRDDPREYTYSREEFENAQTHDPLWNAAQKEMVERGKMHGYMRMYWAKKILEWTDKVEKAFDIALYLNDKYELDGRDPNGYVGVAWAIGGVHDRAWKEREIFGKIRYMSYNGCKRKFDIDKYIDKYG